MKSELMLKIKSKEVESTINKEKLIESIKKKNKNNIVKK
jgi:hypothetical protein